MALKKPPATSNPRPRKRDDSLLAVSLRHLPGGWNTALDYAEIAARDGDAAMCRISASWRQLTNGERNTTTLESLCDLAQVSPADFFAAVARVAFELGKNSAKLIAAVAIPDVVAASVKAAQKADGFRDREALMKHSGILPTPQGARINLDMRNPGSLPAPPPPRGLPTLEEDTLSLTRALQNGGEPRMLVPPASSKKQD